MIAQRLVKIAAIQEVVGSIPEVQYLPFFGGVRFVSKTFLWSQKGPLFEYSIRLKYFDFSMPKKLRKIPLFTFLLHNETFPKSRKDVFAQGIVIWAFCGAPN